MGHILGGRYDRATTAQPAGRIVMVPSRILNLAVGAVFGFVAPMAICMDAVDSTCRRIPRLDDRRRFYVWAGCSTLLVLIVYGWLFGRLVRLLWQASCVESLPLIPTELVTISMDGTMLVLVKSLIRAAFAVVALLLALLARSCHVLVVLICADPIGCLMVALLCSFGQIL